MVKLWWVHPNGQGSIEMGGFNTQEEAVKAIKYARQVLIDQCSNEEQVAVINNGRWETEAVF